ncbi:MAG: ankyrin repeat domain-containing protein [Janthinobacterium lividum]
MQNSLGQKFRSGLAGAVQNNDVAAARLLLQNSLNGLSIEDDDGNTPLIKAVIEQKIGMLYTLLAYAKVEHIDHQRSGDKATALHLAVYGHNPEIVKKLLGDDQG